MHKLIFVVLIFFAGRLHAGTIESGSYTLELMIPGMVVPAGKPHTELTGKIKSGGDTFQFETKGTTGNPVTIHGKLVDERVLMWMTSEEKGNLETFHFIGEFSKDKVVVASGELSLFSKHDKAAAGKWRLRAIK
jgi:hypothetical protein